MYCNQLHLKLQIATTEQCCGKCASHTVNTSHGVLMERLYRTSWSWIFIPNQLCISFRKTSTFTSTRIKQVLCAVTDSVCCKATHMRSVKKRAPACCIIIMCEALLLIKQQLYHRKSDWNCKGDSNLLCVEQMHLRSKKKAVFAPSPLLLSHLYSDWLPAANRM